MAIHKIFMEERFGPQEGWAGEQAYPHTSRRHPRRHSIHGAQESLTGAHARARARESTFAQVRGDPSDVSAFVFFDSRLWVTEFARRPRVACLVHVTDYGG